MRYIKRNSDIPYSLKTAGVDERDKAIEDFKAGRKLKPFKIYKRQDVKIRLEKMFSGKCAYCESRYARTQPMDVEHWRPKGAIELDNGKKTKFGYFWLAADWDNLLPSCIDCNRRREQFDVLEGKKVKIGKQNSFPLFDESKRCQDPDTETDKEDPRIFNPCQDDCLEDCFSFDLESAVIQPAGDLDDKHMEITNTSIRVYALNRIGLVDSRRELLWRIKQKQQTILTLAGLLDKGIEYIDTNPEVRSWLVLIEELIHGELEDLSGYMDNKQEYSLLAKKVIDPFLKQMTGRQAILPTTPPRASF